jgi:hypothetical protein
MQLLYPRHIVKRNFTEEEAEEIFEYLTQKKFEHHKPYMRYNTSVKVPRGQASFTSSIHYDYIMDMYICIYTLRLWKTAGGSRDSNLNPCICLKFKFREPKFRSCL